MVLSGIAGYKRAAPTEMSGWLGGPPHFAQYLCSLEILAALDYKPALLQSGLCSRTGPRMPEGIKGVSATSLRMLVRVTRRVSG